MPDYRVFGHNNPKAVIRCRTIERSAHTTHPQQTIGE